MYSPQKLPEQQDLNWDSKGWHCKLFKLYHIAQVGKLIVEESIWLTSSVSCCSFTIQSQVRAVVDKPNQILGYVD